MNIFRFSLTAAVALVAAAFSILPVSAQINWPTPNAAVNATGGVTMCLNGSNQAVPCSSTVPLPITGGGASATYGSAFPATGGPVALDVAGIAQAWFGLTNGGVTYGLVGVVDNTGTQLNGYTTGTLGVPSSQYLSVQNADPCSYAAKSNVAIAITTATTTSLVAISGSTSIYVCGFSVTISQVVTTANTILFEYGTGATCGTGTNVLTGTYGTGGVTAAAPITVSYGGSGSTIFS